MWSFFIGWIITASKEQVWNLAPNLEGKCEAASMNMFFHYR
jgi:hypothetical protein